MSGFTLGIRLLPRLTILLLVLPVVAGLVGVVAPAFGWLPALGGRTWTLDHWQALWQAPGLTDMLRLSLVTGLASTLLALAIVVLFLAAFLETPLFRVVRRLLSPLLAVPHAAAAIGLAFLLAPSGLASRLFSPWLTGWTQPPDYLFPGDPNGVALIAGLVLKEVPFLLLMSLAALPQCQARERLMVARSLGYGPVSAFAKAVLPGLYPLIRLPVYAVIAFASSTVEVALILGPSTPPPLAVAVVRWLGDPDLSLRFLASAGALLQLAATALALLTWWGAERLVRRLAAGWLIDGGRRRGEATGRVLGATLTWLAIGLLAASLAGLILWSLAAYWPFPAAWPSPMTLRTWREAADTALGPLRHTASIGLGATALSVVLVVGCLEAETLRRRPLRPGAQLILYLPLLVPPVAFLYGLVQLQAQLGLAAGWLAVTLGHSLFVLPYVFLSLAESYRRLDPRWSQVAAALGASRAAIFRRVRLPMLAGPIAVAAAVGFAVSVGQYLPTLLLGAGRLATLTTEAVSLASGGDRRLTAVYALGQLALPALGFALALGLPRLLFHHRRQLLP
ncbi:ABC transporter permease [Halomonas sp. M4R1S46]|uniref:ABC transporter permease n=1 Tax=Halomonas sp. M4R1S46 TaxID=2982692 RepID=UPI0021E3BFDA|nr:ABC transporter permease subunit [Halomonas sp. M4R1S46]UYG06923.1 ABC transporter permease subunit [Halomonas sp. M4R1S46]